MNTMFKHVYLNACAVVMTALLLSCSSESPFIDEGEAHVMFSVGLNSMLTRADVADDLKDNCVIYVERRENESNLLLHKWKGVNNIPSDVYLRYGSYVAEAWTGDSASASFDKIFYYGKTPFSVSSKSEALQVEVKCLIKNVVVSIDEESVNNDLVKDLSVAVSHSKGNLVFADETLYNRGYFMMHDGEDDLQYTITGKNDKGLSFTKTGSIPGVQSAHEYKLKFTYDINGNPVGGTFLSVIIEDEDLSVLDDFVVRAKPSFSWRADGVEEVPEVGDQIIGTRGDFKEHVLRIGAFYGYEDVVIASENEAIKAIFGGHDAVSLLKLDESVKTHLNEKGLTWESDEINEGGSEFDKTYLFRIHFTETFLNSLPESDSAYDMTVTATNKVASDKQTSSAKSASCLVSIANTQTAIAKPDPIKLVETSVSDNLMAVGATSATLTIEVADENIVNPMVQYRKEGESQWTDFPIILTKSSELSISLSGLSEGTDYEYRLVAGELVNGKYEYESKKIYKFTTESKFVIPNSGFEKWSTYSASTLLGKKNVTLPWEVGDKSLSFWGSGNEGSASVNMTLTDKNNVIKHSGDYSARLESKTAAGVLAAGNLFVGYYVKTDGTDGVLQFGREYNGSHPKVLKVYANYRPGSSASVKSGNEGYVPANFSGGLDHGQIYVALTSEPVDIKTKSSERKLFNKDGDEVLAYGEITWTDSFGPDGGLQEVNIPLKYSEKAKTKKPTYLVIVCSASKYGDYFSGAAGSVMYLDDFELVY